MKERFIAPNATVVGEVELGEDVTVWYQAVVRGDSNRIKMGQTRIFKMVQSFMWIMMHLSKSLKM